MDDCIREALPGGLVGALGEELLELVDEQSNVWSDRSIDLGQRPLRVIPGGHRCERPAGRGERRCHPGAR